MENQGEKKKLVIPRVLYNQLTTLFQDKNLAKLVIKQAKLLNGKFVGLESKAEVVAECTRAIRAYVRSKNLPEGWVEPIYSLIKRGELDVPLSGGITLKVGGQEVTGRGELLLILDKYGRLPHEENSISIVITAKVSADRIIKFVKANKKLIEDLQKTINLPEYKPLNWKDLELGVRIIRMKDQEKCSFSEIADKLSKEKETLSVEESDSVPDADVIKTLYHRYKKRLSQ